MRIWLDDPFQHVTEGGMVKAAASLRFECRQRRFRSVCRSTGCERCSKRAYRRQKNAPRDLKIRVHMDELRQRGPGFNNQMSVSR